MSEIQSALVSEDSLMNQSSGTTGYDFDTESDRGMIRSVHIQNASITNAKIGTAAIDTANIKDLAVTSAKINNFSFNQGTGGTLTLGGTTNGNGILKVNNSGGTEVVRIDNSGIAVTNGNISIQDANGTTILNSTGLLSASNFINGVVNDSNLFTTTSSSFVDVTNMSLSFVTVSGTTNVLVGASVHGFNGQVADPSTQYGMVSQIIVDGVAVASPMLTPGIPTSSGIFSMTASTQTIISVSAGTHTFKLQTEVITGGTARLLSTYNKNIHYIILGK